MPTFNLKRSISAGFTYIGALILLAILAIAATATLQFGAIAHRIAAEQELLEIGAEFRAGLISYANFTPPGQPRLPADLADLLRDPRLPGVRRHLRKLYVDPLTGKEEWGTLLAADGKSIAGVFSLSKGKPIKIGNFDARFVGFEKKSSYRDWVFSGETVVAPVLQPASSGNPIPGAIQP